MKTNDVLIIGGIAFVIYLLWKKSAQGGGAGASGGGTGGGSGAGTGGAGCACTAAARPGCPTGSGSFGNYQQGYGPYPPEAFTNYRPPSGNWETDLFHLSFDIGF